MIFDCPDNDTFTAQGRNFFENFLTNDFKCVTLVSRYLRDVVPVPFFLETCGYSTSSSGFMWS